ncbi:MAG TPA: hypothetical protein VF069_03325 [Streptosporangiaceae bacterium]
MRHLMRGLGLFLIFQGVGGTIDQLGVHLFGALYVVKRLPFVDGYAIFTDVLLAILGLVALVAADRPR